MVGFSHGSGVYPREWNLPRMMGSIEEPGVFPGECGGRSRACMVTMSTVEMLGLRPALGRDQNESKRVLRDCENRKSRENGIKIRRSVRVRKWERLV